MDKKKILLCVIGYIVFCVTFYMLFPKYELGSINGKTRINRITGKTENISEFDGEVTVYFKGRLF